MNSALDAGLPLFGAFGVETDNVTQTIGSNDVNVPRKQEEDAEKTKELESEVATEAAH